MSPNDNDDTNLRFTSGAAREAHMCKKPIPSTVGSEPMVFRCLRLRGHEGPCKGALMLRVQ